MSTIKTFFAVHQTKLMIAAAALVIGAKSASFMANENRQTATAPQQQMYNPQGQPNMNQSYMNAPQQPQPTNGGEFWSNWFNDDEPTMPANNNTYYGNTYMPNQYNGYTGTNTYNTTNNNVDYTSGWYKQQAANDANHERFSDYITDQTKYEDGYGNSYKLSSGYDYNYVNSTTNEYIQTNDASYQPDAYSGYSAVTPSSYSSSSYSSSGDE